jgi:transposase
MTYQASPILMAKRDHPDQKTLQLKRTGTLNPHPETVIDPLFKENPFFDPRDLLQVRYEMLRRHSTEAMSILDAAAGFGVSRPTFYQAQSAFSRAGMAGLMPAQRGPKGGHKVTTEVVDYVLSLREAEPAMTTVHCIQAVQQHFGITIHRRSLERALVRSKKKLHGRT